MPKIIRRQVLIREKDFKTKLRPSALSYNLYDRAHWEPLSRLKIDQGNMWEQLQGHGLTWKIDVGNAFNFENFKIMPLYNNRYDQWRVWTEGDEFWIQPTNHNGKPSRLGIATLEKG